MDVLAEAHERRLAHRLIRPTAQIFYDPLCNLGRNPCSAARLKQRQVVEAIAFIINDDVAVNLLVRREPLKHLLAPGNPASVWANVVERDTIKLRGKKADRIGSPRRRENDSCSRPAHQVFEHGEEIGVYDVRELTWIGGRVGVQDPIDV